MPRVWARNPPLLPAIRPTHRRSTPTMTRHTRTGVCVSTVLVSATACLAQPCDFSEVDAGAQAMLNNHPGLPGVGVLVGNRDGIIHEAYFGTYRRTTVVPLASASKLISATAIMTLIDAGRLDPQAPLRTLLPEFSRSNAGLVKSSLTVDECYSMTSGFPGEDADSDILNNLTITNDEAVAQIACCVGLDALPGTDLRYSGLGMHVVGVVAERVSGLPFDQFFSQAVSVPLGTDSIGWQGLGETENFRPSGGGEASMRDYGRILRTLLRGGEIGGTRLLSENAVQSMFVERTAGLPIASAPQEAIDNGYGYAFGMWVEERAEDGTPTVLSSPGAFGFTPWLDLTDDYWGIVMVDLLRQPLIPEINSIRDAIDEAIALGCRSCLVDFDQDGTLNIDDVLIFLGGFSQGLPLADFDASGSLDIDDVLGFLDAFATGC